MISEIYVQFAGDNDESIVTVFGGPQKESNFPHYGTMPSDDLRYVTYYDEQYPQIQKLLIKPGE